MPHIDLHAHSDASDGQLTPAALVARAAAAGLKTLALTDHDSVAGLAAADAAARPLGLDLVPGVEISVGWEGHTVHVLGLGIEPDSPTLNAGLTDLQAARAVRARTIQTRLAKARVPVEVDDSDPARLTRTHFARALVAAGHASSLREAFQRFLTHGRAGYVRGDWASLEAAVGWIRAAGGIAVLAHPLRYKLSATKRRALLTAFQAAGGEGIEVVWGNASPDEIATAAELARRQGLMASVGSDFHGPEQHWLALGRLPALPRDLTPVWEARGWAA
jgi:predicted metal-dependent phosphoesterase TrpH